MNKQGKKEQDGIERTLLQGCNSSNIPLGQVRIEYRSFSERCDINTVVDVKQKTENTKRSEEKKKKKTV